MQPWSERLREALAWKGWSTAELARRSGVDTPRLYKYLKGTVVQPRGETLAQLAAALGVNLQWLRDGRGPHFTNLPVVGYVGAGEAFVPIDDLAQGGGYDEIEFDIEAGDPIAVQVRGSSMEPVYRPGDYLICSRRKGEDEANFLGRDCVVLLDSGEGYVKRVVRGSAPDRYTLISYAAPPIENVVLLWAAPIIWVRRQA